MRQSIFLSLYTYHISCNEEVVQFGAENGEWISTCLQISYEGGSESSVIGVITMLIDMIDCYIRATFRLYNDAEIMPERNKYFERDALKDTWGKTNGTFSRHYEYYCAHL